MYIFNTPKCWWNFTRKDSAVRLGYFLQTSAHNTQLMFQPVIYIVQPAVTADLDQAGAYVSLSQYRYWDRLSSLQQQQHKLHRAIMSSVTYTCQCYPHSQKKNSTSLLGLLPVFGFTLRVKKQLSLLRPHLRLRITVDITSKLMYRGR